MKNFCIITNSYKDEKNSIANKISDYIIKKGGDIMRKKVVLICTQCLSRNYQVSVKVEGKTERIEMMKFCPKCNQHTLHKESK